MKLTPLTARKALLAALIKARSSSKTCPLPNTEAANIIDLLTELENEINELKNPGRPSQRERLEDKINEANNSFGISPYHDGLNQYYLNKLKAELASLSNA